MGAGDLDAMLAELKQAEADLAVLHRQISAEQKNEAKWDDYGISDIEELREEASKLFNRIEELKIAIAAATTPPALGDESTGDLPALTLDEPDPVDAPPLPPTEVFNRPSVSSATKAVDEPMLHQAPDLQLGPQSPADPMAEEVAFEVASPGTTTDAPPTKTRLRKALLVGAGVVLFVGAGVGLAVVGSKPAPVATLPPSATTAPPATATAPPATATAPPATATAAPTQPLVIVGPIRYASECNGDCFMEVDPATCDRTFHFVLALLGDAATVLEGKTAIISTVGPGLQPTYEVPVVGGRVTLDAVAKGSDYGANPNAACAANASWTGLLTSVDGIPTTTPDAPT